MRPRAMLWGLALLVAGGCAGGEGEKKPEKRRKTVLTVRSNAFASGTRIPKRHAYEGEGENVSPALSWSGVPRKTRELALLCDDPDAPVEEPWVHWVLYRIPPAATGIPEGATAGGTAGKNSWGETAWGGPMPPKGHGTHHYYFKVFALAVPLQLEAGATKQELLAAMQGHILAEGELVGTYSR
ncbi:MAG: YbhB/YbcL family Raf kinase inhibitor-like protein [Planctomycetota bacterium]